MPVRLSVPRSRLPRLAATVGLLSLSLAACKGEAPAPGEAQLAPSEAPTAAADASALALGAMALQTPASQTRTFRDWSVTCNNLNACTAWGPGEDTAGFVLVSLAAGPEARPSVVIGANQTVEGTGPLVALLDGQRHAGRADRSGDNGQETLHFAQAPSGLINGLGRGRSLQLTRGTERLSFSLSGAAAAFLWIDERQGRLDTTTALIRRGNRAASSVPAALPAPVVTPAPPVAQTGLNARDLPTSLSRLPAVQECLADDHLKMEPGKARLSADTVLWAVPCGAGAYNFSHAYFLTANDGSNPRPVSFPTTTTPETVLINSDYDPASRSISMFSKGRGLGDCGTLATWVWTGQAFTLETESAMPDCIGISPDLWPYTWQSSATQR